MRPCIETLDQLLARTERHGDCMVWTGALQSRGYGQTAISGRQTSSHRAAWTLAFGAIPAGMFVCHRCDRRACINPEHLFLGTAKDNSTDMVRKGRSPRGPRQPRSKLNPTMVREIRARLHSGDAQVHIARAFGISQSLVSEVKRGNRWGWV